MENSINHSEPSTQRKENTDEQLNTSADDKYTYNECKNEYVGMFTYLN